MENELIRISKLKNIENWSIWKFQVRVILKANNAWDVVNGDSAKPVQPAATTDTATSQEYEKQLKQWQRLDGLAQKVIVTTMEQQPMLHIINADTANEMWKKLTSVYEQKSEASIHVLQQKWFSSTKDPSDDIPTHIAKLEDLAHRLKLMGEEISDKMLMTKILLTLPAGYDYFISAWESTPEAERTKNNLISRLTIEEFRQVKRTENEGNALTSSGYNHKRKPFKYNDGNKQTSGTQRQGKCHKCHKFGHWARECKTRVQKGNTGTYGEGLLNEALASVQQELGSKVLTWFLDSGATHHMSYRRDWFVSYRPLNNPMLVRIGDGHYLNAYGTGEINILAHDGEKWNENHIRNVLFVPKLHYNLFSSGVALDKGLELQSNSKYCRFIKNNCTVAVGERTDRLFTMKFEVKPPHKNKQSKEVAQASAAIVENLETWHRKLVHQNYQKVKQVLNQFEIEVKDKSTPFCDACAIGKIHRLPFPASDSKTDHIGELIHADVCGPLQVKSMKGARYFTLFKDDFSHYRVVYFMAAKSDAPACIENFVKKTEKHCPRGIKILRTDNGLEFVNKEVNELLNKHGIQHQRTVTYSPEQNGAAERENRTVVEAARTVLHAQGYDLKFWAEAVNHVVYVLNYTGNSQVKGVTPYEIWYSRKPKITSLHIFGEEVYSHIPKIHRQKLDMKAKKGYFLGYEENVKGFRVWFPEENKVEILRDLVFTGRTQSVKKRDCEQGEALLYLPEDVEEPAEESKGKYDLPQSIEENEENADDPDCLPQQQNRNKENSEPAPTRELRDRSKIKIPDRFGNQVIDMQDLFIAETFIAEDYEPINYIEAIRGYDSQKWKSAMEEEMKSLYQNNVWDLVEPPKNQPVIENRWVYKVKKDANGNVQRYKARLVAKGYNQKKGVDYQETFSPVVRFDSIRLILTFAAQEKLFLRQFDIKTAFLNGEIEGSVFMKQPEGHSDGTNRVCKLQRSIYGLKQSSRCWNRRFTQFLEKHSLKSTNADPCVFVSTKPNVRLFLAIYIDDGLLAADSQEVIDDLLSKLTEEFEITHNEVSMFLGLQIEQMKDKSIILHQSLYTQKIIEKFKMDDANPVSIPADPHQSTFVEGCSTDLSERTKAPYREAIGSLMYLSVGTRPDITFAVNRASRYLDNPTKVHWNMVKRIIKYLKGTLRLGLKFQFTNFFCLKVFSDADYAGEDETKRSTTGYLLQLGDSLIAWNSQRQRSVALSTTESEYMAACESVKEIMWLKKLVDEWCKIDTIEITLYLDNQSAIQMIKNPVYHKRTKHVDVRYHYVRERYEEKNFKLEYVNTKEQLADILTKPLVRQQFQQLRNVLCCNMESLYK